MLSRIFGAIESAFQAAYKVDPVHPKDPALAKLWGLGMQTNSGVRVDHEKTLALPAIFRGINIVSNSVSRVPYDILKYETGDDENGKPAKGHTSYRCVTSYCSPEFKLIDLRKTMTAWAMLYGNAVAYIDRPGWPNGGSVELVPLLPDRTRPVRLTTEMTVKYDIARDRAGALYYETQIGDNTVWYSAENCLHIKGLGGNPYWGYDVVDRLKEAIGGAIARQEFGHRFYGGGANPAGFIEMPTGLEEEDEERFIESIQRQSQGMGRAHKLMVLEEGAKFHQWTIDPEKAQFLDGLQLDYRTIANVVGIKVHKLVDAATSSYNSLEQSNSEHRDDDLYPWIMQWKHEMHEKLLTEDQKKNRSHEVVIDDEYLDGWVPFLDRARGVVELKNNDIITRNQARRRLNFRPSDDGDDFTIPMNIEFTKDKKSMAKIEQKLAKNPPPPPPMPGQPPEPGKEDGDEDGKEKKGPKEDATVWTWSVDRGDMGTVFIDGVKVDGVIACNPDLAEVICRDEDGQTIVDCDDRGENARVRTELVEGKVTFVPFDVIREVRSDASAMKAAWLGKISDRLGKQAVKMSTKGPEAFRSWVEKLNTESAPDCVQSQVDSLYGTIKTKLSVITETSFDDDASLVEAVSNEVETWETTA